MLLLRWPRALAVFFVFGTSASYSTETLHRRQKTPPFCHRYCAGDDTIADGPGRSCRDAPPSMAPLRSSQYFRVLAFGRFDEILYLVEKASVLTRPDLQSCGWRSE